MQQTKVLERITLSKTKVLSIESDIRFHEHLRRYASVRRFCYGKVLDFATGCGYGAHIIAANPDVEKVTGIDKDALSIEWAKKEFLSEKIEFKCTDIENVCEKFDTLVCLEAIEHFADTTLVPRLVGRCSIDTLIISYPNKKSTNFNPYHLHDFNVQRVLDLFPNYICYKTYTLGDVQFLLFVRKPERAPTHIFSNILDW